MKGNNISDINVLEKVNFEKLKSLWINNNYISQNDIDSFENSNLKNLKAFYTFNNSSDSSD